MLVGCGYVGPVLPPSPLIPNGITDLSVLERGDRLWITFNVPARTTDQVAIKNFSEIDLRIGPSCHSLRSCIVDGHGQTISGESSARE